MLIVYYVRYLYTPEVTLAGHCLCMHSGARNNREISLASVTVSARMRCEGEINP